MWLSRMDESSRYSNIASPSPFSAGKPGMDFDGGEAGGGGTGSFSGDLLLGATSLEQELFKGLPFPDFVSSGCASQVREPILTQTRAVSAR